MYVRWGRANKGEMEGIRISFVFDKFVDEYDFFDKPSIDYVMTVLSQPNFVPEHLLLEIRDRMNITVH